MANPYSKYKIDYSGFLGQAPPDRRKDASGWDQFGNWLPAIGGALGAVGGGALGLLGGPGGVLAGATAGGTLGTKLGESAGGAAKDYGSSLLDPERERELRKQALLEAISGLRGF